MRLWNQVPQEWQPLIADQERLITTIGNELIERQEQGADVTPAWKHIFRALECDISKISVVIVGQDPYPTGGHATGLAFSVPSGTAPLPPTLRNILKEVCDDVGLTSCPDGNLESWSQQGVLLLNRVLTVDVGVSTSHHNLGWQRVTQAILREVIRVNPQVVGMLWGRQAQELQDLFESKHMLSSAHPSPLSAYRGFFGSKPFSRANTLLEHQGRSPIIW